MLVDDDESSNDEESIVLEGSYYGEWTVSKGHGKWRQGGFLGSIHEHVSIYLLYIKMSPALRTKYGGLDSEYVRGVSRCGHINERNGFAEEGNCTDVQLI